MPKKRNPPTGAETRFKKTAAWRHVRKICAPDTLVEAVARIAAGDTFLEPEMAQKLAFHRVGRRESPQGLNNLSSREFEVFCLLAQGMSTREAADKLQLGVKTVSNYASIIKDKLNISNAAELVRLAYQYGIIKTE